VEQNELTVSEPYQFDKKSAHTHTHTHTHTVKYIQNAEYHLTKRSYWRASVRIFVCARERARERTVTMKHGIRALGNNNNPLAPAHELKVMLCGGIDSPKLCIYSDAAERT
jgi:hypothetical protein